MERLWASWRMAYISGEKKKYDGCIFCDFPKAGNDREYKILYQGEYSYIIMNAFPYSNGHLMVIPKRHTNDFTSLSDEESSEIMKLGRLAMKALTDVYHPHGFNVGWNIGEVAGAGIAQHIHMHIVPRWNGDTNFMPVLGDTRVIPEDLETGYAKIKGAIDRLLSE